MLNYLQNQNKVESLSNLVIKKYEDITEIVYNERASLNMEIPFIKIEEDHFNDTFNEFNDDLISDDNEKQLKVCNFF